MKKFNHQLKFFMLVIHGFKVPLWEVVYIEFSFAEGFSCETYFLSKHFFGFFLSQGSMGACFFP